MKMDYRDTVERVFKLIGGNYFGYEGASWSAAISALVNMGADKIEVSADHGIEISEEEWHSHHLPQQLMTDWGEF